MKKLESISQDISSVYHKLDRHAWDLKNEMRKIQQENLLPGLIGASEKYEKYVSSSHPGHYASQLADDYWNDKIQTRVTVLRED